MAAYAVFLREAVRDAEQMARYTELAPGSLAGHDMKVLAAYGKQENIEGTTSDGVVILEFPTIEAAKAWYNSPAYQEALAYRLRGADYRVVFVEGLA